MTFHLEGMRQFAKKSKPVIVVENTHKGFPHETIRIYREHAELVFAVTIDGVRQYFSANKEQLMLALVAL